MSDTPLISGPASSLLHSRLQGALDSLNSILQELSIVELHLYPYPDGSPSIYLRTSDGRRWGGHHCGPAGASLPDHGLIIPPPASTVEPSNAKQMSIVEDPAPIKSPPP